MSSDHKVATDLSAGFPFWSKSYADFVTDKELMEAKEAVEDCYRRRARRAGLEETLPRDRPMTEEEINELSERLGDGKGSRVKCAREIEELTIEDKEAEIRKTNAAIRRRRRMGTGLLSMSLVLLMCLVVTPVESFTAYDCSNQSNVVESYSLLEPDACANMGRDGEVETTVWRNNPNQAGQDDPDIQVHGGRDPSGAVLRDVLSSGSHRVHPLPGAEASRSLRMPQGEAERSTHHQRADSKGQDRSNRLPQHVPVRRPR
jgi:hypothetical protein